MGALLSGGERGSGEWSNPPFGVWSRNRIVLDTFVIQSVLYKNCAATFGISG